VQPIHHKRALRLQRPHPNRIEEKKQSVHLSDQFVDVAFPVTEVSTLDEVLEFALSPATCRVGELEGPEEVGCLQL
jgi:hypothetical protein